VKSQSLSDSYEISDYNTIKGATYVVHDFAHLLFLGVILHGSEVIQGINRGLKLVSMVLTSFVVIGKKNDIYRKFTMHS
jgi:hypothetical protein